MLYDINTYRVTTLKELFTLLRTEPKSAILAGGTDILVAMKHWDHDFESLIDITPIKELKGIRELKSQIRIGSLTTWAEFEVHPAIIEHAMCLVDAAAVMGSPQIRNLGTLGGNVVNASPAGDSLPALYLLDAVVELISSKGSRKLPITDFIKGPRTVTSKKGEILKSITLNKKYAVTGFDRLGTRKSLAISKISLAAGLTLNKGVIHNIGITLGAVGAVILVVKGLEKFHGQPLNKSVIDEIAQLAEATATPISDIRSTKEYRKDMVAVLTKRLLKELLTRSKKETR